MNRSTGNFHSILILLLLLVCSMLSSEETELRPYKLINADKLIINKIDGEYVTNLLGNVHFFYGETEFFSDKADIFELQKIVKMTGNVQVYEDTLSLLADHVDYFRKQERLFLRGDVLATETHIDSTRRTFEAQEVEYFRNTREFFARDSVKTFDERENMYGKCGELKYFMNDGYGYLIKQPLLSIADKDTLSITAEKIEYFENYKKVAATFNVNTFSEQFNMASDFLLYFTDDEKAIYQGQPMFTSDFADAQAQEFRIFFQDQKIRKAVLQDSCAVQFSDAADKPKNNWAVSDQMEFNFVHGNITYCQANENVESYFAQERSDSKDFSANRSTGEHLVIELNDDNKITKISMQDDVQGIYKFKRKNW